MIEKACGEVVLGKEEGQTASALQLPSTGKQRKLCKMLHRLTFKQPKVGQLRMKDSPLLITKINAGDIFTCVSFKLIIHVYRSRATHCEVILWGEDLAAGTQSSKRRKLSYVLPSSTKFDKSRGIDNAVKCELVVT